MAFGNWALLVGIVLLVAGFGFKISAAPFQMWVPDVYEGAPTPVVAFLSVASKAAGFAVLFRVLFTGFFDVSLDWAVLMAALAAASMTIGNVVAIAQSNIPAPLRVQHHRPRRIPPCWSRRRSAGRQPAGRASLRLYRAG